MSNFQTILLAILASVFVFAVLIFADVIQIGKDKEASVQGKILVWGTQDATAMRAIKDKIENDNDELIINYVKKSEETYQQELIEAFANGSGPDLFIIDPGMMKRNANFIYKIPYTAYPQKNFKDTFIEGAQIYIDQDGIVGLPLYVDPLVVYYNKDILTNNRIPSLPKTWDQLFELNETLTKRDNFGKIDQSMIALGQFSNVNNAKDILATLLIQNDNNIVEKILTRTSGNSDQTTSTVSYESLLRDNSKNYQVTPAESVLQFFLEFSNVSKSAYSWNKSLANSLDVFAEGKLAFYVGRASELFKIEEMNPNLSFDVTKMLQSKGSSVDKTFGEIYGVVINKKSTNLTTAFTVLGLMTSPDNVKELSRALSLPPAIKSLIAEKPVDNSYLHTFFDSALISRTWIDVDKKQTSSIFQDMVESSLSNSLSPSQAINKASDQLDIILK